MRMRAGAGRGRARGPDLSAEEERAAAVTALGSPRRFQDPLLGTDGGEGGSEPHRAERVSEGRWRWSGGMVVMGCGGRDHGGDAGDGGREGDEEKEGKGEAAGQQESERAREEERGKRDDRTTAPENDNHPTFLERTTLTQRLPWRRTRFTTSASR